MYPPHEISEFTRDRWSFVFVVLPAHLCLNLPVPTHIFFKVADFRIVFASFHALSPSRISRSRLLSQLFQAVSLVLPEIPDRWIAAIVPIVIISETLGAVGAISVAAEPNSCKNTRFCFRHLFLLFCFWDLK